MKKLLAFAIGAALSLSAVAGPATSLPGGPIYLKFNGNEQIAVGPGNTTFAGSNEINWGVFTLSTMEVGAVNMPHDAIAGTGDIFFFNNNKSQITGMFYGIEAGTPNAGNPFAATGGFVDLYWRDLEGTGLTKTSNATTLPGIRCGFNCATGYTEGTFLARLKFDTGMDQTDPNNSIVGTVVPNPPTFTGLADSYASVDLSAGGLWAEQLDTNWFSSWQGLRDMRFKNSYNPQTTWNGAPGIVGARIDDPAQAVALPEPGALSLMGLTLAGMGAVLRRRQKKEKA
jgi:hypothetical protein